HAASWAPWMILPPCEEVAMSSEMNPTLCDRRRLRLRARAFLRQPSSSTAAQMRSRVSCGMLALGESFTTKDTVVCDTPASVATSYIDGGVRRLRGRA